MIPLTLAFSESEATRLENSGGKGANLSFLAQRGFPVPFGFVVTPRVYREFTSSARELLVGAAKFSSTDTTARREWVDHARAALERLTLPADAIEQIRDRLAAFNQDQAWSVRSSSTMEDLANAAFAGQHETYLNCRGVDRIVARIKDCFLSLWSDRAVAYRQQQRFDHTQAAMAVVVQHMIPCDVAGVAFSVNPITGDLSEMIIDANFGLGESVVSGDAEVDHFTLDRQSLAVRTAEIANKTRRVVPTAEGVGEATIDAGESARPALNPGQLRELGELLMRIEQVYGFPQDIEWGFAAGNLHLLQSRPITTIPPRWTRDESAERFTNAISPLTWDFVEAGFHRSLNHSFRLMGLPPFTGQWFGMHGHYIYGNQNAVELYGRRTPFAPRTLDELRTAIPVLRKQFSWVLELPVAWQRDLDFYLLKIGEFLAEPLADRPLADVWDFVRRVNEHGAQYFLPNIAISLTQGTLYRFLHHLLRLVLGSDEANGFFDRLMGFCETKTGLINQELVELARLAGASELRALSRLSAPL